ncbi:lytic transglycosylase domain-containing protein [Novosphingobium bradum]|uniref:Lytic transglycosylase domain-containing protein n=1 Tax=Novosphingobium bradum TaxID=1737444 RepID=A0ABV7IRR9_9SPHN
MSGTAITGADRTQGQTQTRTTRAAIAQAAQATGVDFDYLLAQARLESGLNPQARAGSSSARGLYQFLGGTWLDTLRKHGAEHGLGWAAQAAADPARRAEIMALRDDPQASALMAAELAGDNRAALSGALGREPDGAELYLAHFLGVQGATRMLAAEADDPSQSAAALLPAAAGANRAIFHGPGGAPRSVGEVLGLVRGRFAAAMSRSDGLPADFPLASAASSGAVPAGGPVAREFHALAGSAVTPAPARPSMAETLRQAFALGGGQDGAVPAHVRSAYGRLAALGL